MGRSKRRKMALRRKGSSVEAAAAALPLEAQEFQDAGRERNCGRVIMLILLLFGVYQGVLYFGHQVFPNSDFPAFSHVGRDILSFQRPYSFKRVPVWGMLHVSLGWLIGGQHPDFTAALILNAVFHAGNAVLLYLIGRRLIPRSAGWFAVIALINPYSMRMLVDPIAETCLLFFTLLTIYLIVRRSGWAYLGAAVTTMVRYEGAGLIVAAFVIDMITARGTRKRLFALLYAALAGVPLAVWMIATKLSWKSGVPTGTHYLRAFGGGRFYLIENLTLFWRASIKPLFASRDVVEQTFAGGGMTSVERLSIFTLSKIITILACTVGIVYALIKRHWQVLAIVIYLGLYVLVHALRPHPRYQFRYYVPVAFGLVLWCWFGLQSGRQLLLRAWQLLTQKIQPSLQRAQRVARKDHQATRTEQQRKWVFITIQTVVLIAGLIWLGSLLSSYQKFTLGRIPAGAASSVNWFGQCALSIISKQSTSLPYVAAGVAALLVGVRWAFYKSRFLLADLVIAVVVCVMIFSSQLTLVGQLGNGKRDIEFKRLTDWYCRNAEPGERLITTMGHVMAIYAPQQKEYFRHMGMIKADTTDGFFEECYRKNITYITWASRLGMVPRSPYYKRYGMGRIAPLARPQDYGPCRFLCQIPGDSRRRYINVFRLRDLPADRKPAP